MNRRISTLATMCFMLASRTASADDLKAPAEVSLKGTNGVEVIVRAQGPYDADVALQVVCFFKHRKEGDTTLGAAVELDRRLGGAISSLRNREEFSGDDQETLLLTPPSGTIKPGLLLLVGLGDPVDLSLSTLERVGRTAQRHASMLGITRVAFAPLLRDQGNARFGVREVASAVLRGVLSSYDLERRLQKQHLAKEYALRQWIVEAGPVYFDDTVKGARLAISAAMAQ